MKLNGLICLPYGFPAFRLQRLHHRWTADGNSAHGDPLRKAQRLRRKAQRSAHDVKPRLRDPAAIFALRIGWIEQMPKAMLGVAVLLVIDPLAQQRRFAIGIAKEERVSLGGNRQAPQLPLPPGLRIEVVLFDFQNRAGW